MSPGVVADAGSGNLGADWTDPVTADKVVCMLCLQRSVLSPNLSASCQDIAEVDNKNAAQFRAVFFR